MKQARWVLIVVAVGMLGLSGPAFGMITEGESEWGNEGNYTHNTNGLGGNVPDLGDCCDYPWWGFQNAPESVLEIQDADGNALGAAVNGENARPPAEILSLQHGPAGPGGPDGVFVAENGMIDLTRDNHNAQFTMDLRTKITSESSGELGGDAPTSGANYIGPGIDTSLIIPTGSRRFFVAFGNIGVADINPVDNHALTISLDSVGSSALNATDLDVDWSEWNTVRIVGTGLEDGDARLKVYANANPTPLADILVPLTGAPQLEAGILIGPMQPRLTAGTVAHTMDIDFIRVLRTSDGNDGQGLALDGPPLVPEPATFGLFVLGAVAMFRRSRRAA